MPLSYGRDSKRADSTRKRKGTMEKLQDLIIHDTRLEGVCEEGQVLTVNMRYPLRLAITWVIVKSVSYNRNVRVRVMAHGAPGCVMFCDDGMHLDLPADFKLQPWTTSCAPGLMGPDIPPIASKGGMICFPSYGLQSSLGAFRAWRGYVKQIDIMCCDVARIKEAGKWNDGNLMCYTLAQITGAYVRASAVDQFYGHHGWLAPACGHFMGWEGVMVYTPTGGGAPKSPYDESRTSY
jgi:hypothetical protein